MFIEWIVLGSLVLFLILLICLGAIKRKKVSTKTLPIVDETEEPAALKVCPLCKTPLQKGENVHSELFPGKEDRLMHIQGCPYCYKKLRGNNRSRYCPFCKDLLEPKDYVIARVFTKPGKTYVHVLGCTRCRGKS